MRIYWNPRWITILLDPIVECRIAFRFEEIREVVHIIDSGANVRKPFQLSRNYRSHSGIVTLGMAVVGLLREHFGVDFMANAEEAVLKGMCNDQNQILRTCKHHVREPMILNILYSLQGLDLPSSGWTSNSFRARWVIAKYSFSFWIRKVGRHASRRPRPWVV